MKEVNTNPGKTYAVTSPNGCTVTQHVGEVDIVTNVPAGQQTLIIAHAGKFEIDDDSAIVTECGGSAELVFTAATTRAASSGTGCDCGFTAEERALLMGAAQRDADNTFSAGNTFTGAVDMSGASVTPPEGWNVAELTPEAIQAVVPIGWETLNVRFGVGAKVSTEGVCIGAYAKSGWDATAVGYGANANGLYSVAVAGRKVTADKPCSITIGSYLTETTDSGTVTHTCTTEGTGSITIGAGANTLNNGDTESSNSVTIGCKAENKGADSVVIGAQASGAKAGGVAVGAEAKTLEAQSIAIGRNSQGGQGFSVAVGGGAKAVQNSSTAIGGHSEASSSGVSVGFGAKGTADNSICLGVSSFSKGKGGIAIGYHAKVADKCAIVLRSFAYGEQYSTNLYFAGANTPLAATYEGGEAMMGYVVRDEQTKEIVAAGTQKLSVLFPNNSGFQPMALSLDDDMTPPTVFHPSDLDMPQEEPTEPEDYQPLPVYPIVEPEIPEMEEV